MKEAQYGSNGGRYKRKRLEKRDYGRVSFGCASNGGFNNWIAYLYENKGGSSTFAFVKC